MHFLIHSWATREAAHAGPDDDLNERHWSYMDRFADGLTARGPTLAPDRETWTGSMHVVTLPTVEAAHAFVDDEPYARAGRFESHRLWQFTDLLGRTMWEHAADPDEPRFLVLGTPVLPDLPPERLILQGELRTLEGHPAGFALAVQLPDRSGLDGLEGLGADVHDWEPGGRR